MGGELAVLLLCGLIGSSQFFQISKNFYTIRKCRKYKDHLREHLSPLSVNEAKDELNKDKSVKDRMVHITGIAVSGSSLLKHNLLKSDNKKIIDNL